MSEPTREELIKESIYDIVTINNYARTQAEGEDLAEMIYDAIWEHIKEDL